MLHLVVSTFYTSILLMNLRLIVKDQKSIESTSIAYYIVFRGYNCGKNELKSQLMFYQISCFKLRNSNSISVIISLVYLYHIQTEKQIHTYYKR